MGAYEYGASLYCPEHHAADTDADGTISLSELLRVIQFFNSAGYHPCPEGEDGFCPGSG